MDLSGRGNLMFIGCKTLKLEHLLPIDKRESLFCKLQKNVFKLDVFKKTDRTCIMTFIACEQWKDMLQNVFH